MISKTKTKIKIKTKARGGRSTSSSKSAKNIAFPVLTKTPVLSLEGCPCLGCPYNESGNDECLDLQKATECSLIEACALDSYSDSE